VLQELSTLPVSLEKSAGDKTFVLLGVISVIDIFEAISLSGRLTLTTKLSPFRTRDFENVTCV
jgi:hypothetical protein